MKAKYLGLDLSSPVVVSSSPYTATVANIGQCVANGAGAVVLKSIFEEQIIRHAAALDYPSQGMGDSGEYLERYLGDAYKGEFLKLVSDARTTGVPVIASINCIAADDGWTDYAVAMEAAGAAALELNIFLQPTDRHRTAQELEQDYADVVRRVAAAVKIPVSVKLPMRLTNVLAVADSLLARGARGVVMFNRFFEPDIDVERMAFVNGNPFSEPAELRNVLRSVALCSTALPQLDVAVSTGVHDGEAAVKALLCGANAVQVCSAIHEKGFGVIAGINRFIEQWAERHGFESLGEFRGRMDYGNPERHTLLQQTVAGGVVPALQNRIGTFAPADHSLQRSRPYGGQYDRSDHDPHCGRLPECHRHQGGFGQDRPDSGDTRLAEQGFSGALGR